VYKKTNSILKHHFNTKQFKIYFYIFSTSCQVSQVCDLLTKKCFCDFIISCRSKKSEKIMSSSEEIDNRKVKTVRWMNFDDGLFIEDSEGGEWLIHMHTTPSDDKGHPDLVDASDEILSSKWKSGDSKSKDVSDQSKTLGDLMELAEGRGGYGYVINNCSDLVVSLLQYMGEGFD
jgi:hypothetical protein